MLGSAHSISRMKFRDKRSKVTSMLVVSVVFCVFVQVQVALAEQGDGTSNEMSLSSTTPPQAKSLVDYMTTAIPVTQESGSASSKLQVEMEGSNNIFKELTSAEEVFKKFDNDKDDHLNLEEFGALCEHLFTNGSVKYDLSNSTLETLFNIFDWNSNGLICQDEFEMCYNEWIRKIVDPVSVLVIVDVQNDFISGSLALKNAPAGQEGTEVLEPINKMLDTVPFRYVYYSKDWHPADHISFIENVGLRKLHDTSPIQDPSDAKVFDKVIFEGNKGQPIEQILWPTHCVINTWGSELHKDLQIAKNSKDVYKGIQSDMDSYSAFLDNDKKSMTPLKMYIDEVGANDVYVCGLATEVCVGATSIDALNFGYRTILVEDASRGLDLANIEKRKQEIIDNNGVVTTTDKVKSMVNGVDRRPELGLHLAKALHKEKLVAVAKNQENAK